MTLCTNRITLDIEEALYWKCVSKAAKQHQDVSEWITSVIETVIENPEGLPRRLRVSKETHYTYKELIHELVRLKPNKNPAIVIDSFKHHLRRRRLAITKNNYSLPVPLYVNDTGIEDFYIVEYGKTESSWLFKKVHYD